jgi:uncharacterized protein
MSTIQRLTDSGLLRPPRWLPSNVQYETIMGSVAYGVSSDTSDVDVYGWAIPPKEDIFPHLRGEILGFGTHAKRFEQFEEHHVRDPDALAGNGRTYDLTIFGIVKFFRLAMENNPNVIDSLFTPATCVLHSTRVGNLVRENRRLFLHRGAWPKFKGYAYSQLHKLAIKKPTGKRAEVVARHGFDVKFAYHVVRLLGEVEQILVEGDIDLQRDNERLKAIRRGGMDGGSAPAVGRRQGGRPGTRVRCEHAAANTRRAEAKDSLAELSRGALRVARGVRARTRPGRRDVASRSGRTRSGEGFAVTDIVSPKAMARLRDEVARHPYPLIFATVSGAHLYGFPSPDSDYDLRGCHVLPVVEVVGLDPGRETVELSTKDHSLELDLVTHDAHKFFRLLLKKNGYVLEQVHSPLVVHTTPEHEELKSIARQCVTRYHCHHYFGFAATQWRLFDKERPRRVKPLLYLYRVLLTGIHLMRTGVVEANLVRLNEEARLPHVADLIARKQAGPEQSTLDDTDVPFHQREYDQLRTELELASQSSALPELAAGRAALNDLLVRLRLRPQLSTT